MAEKFQRAKKHNQTMAKARTAATIAITRKDFEASNLELQSATDSHKHK